jgi:hypothetical protein
MPSDVFARSSNNYSDNFNRANGGLGANWTTWATGTFSPSAPQISSNQVVGNAASYFMAYYSGASFPSSSQFSQITCPVGGNSASGGVDVMVNTSTNNGYVGQFYNGNFRIDTMKANVHTLGSNVAGTLNSGDVLRIESIQLGGIACVSLYQNGTIVDFIIDTTPVTGGAPGFGVYGNASQSVADNWIGGTSLIGSGDLGSNWTVQTGSLTISGGNVSATGSASSVDCYAIWTKNLFPEDHQSQATISSLGTGKCGVLVRMAGLNVYGNSSSLASGYSGVASSGAWAINKVAANDAITVLASGSTTWNTNDTILLVVKGTTLTLYQNGVALGSATDSSYLAGHAGIYTTGNSSITDWTGTPIVNIIQVASDSFERAGPALGSNWTQLYGAGGIGAVSAEIIVPGSSGVPGGVGQPNNSDGAPIWNANSFNADCYSQVTMYAATLPSTYGVPVGIGVTLRQVQGTGGNANTSTGYTFVTYYGITMANAPTYWPHALTWYSGASTLNFLSIKGGCPFQLNDVVFQTDIGDTASGYINGILDLQVRDTSSLGVGQPGINDYQIYNEHSGNVLVTNFSAGNLLATWAISGSAGTAGATVSYSGPSSGSVIADGSGNYIIDGLANGTYTITPSLTGYIFSPTNSSQTISDGNITGVNFTAAQAGGGSVPWYLGDQNYLLDVVKRRKGF